ncbi:hypothetical protein ACWD25_15310 [Streptomyces sp. NPDC002920]
MSAGEFAAPLSALDVGEVEGRAAHLFEFGGDADVEEWNRLAGADVPALVAEVRRLLAERHVTNEVLSDAAERMRADRDRIAELEATLRLRSTQRGDVGRLIEVAGQSGEDCVDVDELRVALSLDADDVGVEPVGEFYTTVHHAYRPGLGRDLPELGGLR